MQTFRQIIQSVKKECGNDVSITTHIIETDSKKFDSVKKVDRFFNDVYLVTNLNEFIKLVRKDRKLEAMDVAKYILTKRPCNHLLLEKLVYFCYADYLVATKKKLFDDKIYAYTYGPIINSIYSKFKRRGLDELKVEEIDGNFEPNSYLPARSRILSADDGFLKCFIIERTLLKLSKLDVWDIVNLTHKKGSPWERTQQSCVILDSDILKYHYVEDV